MSTNEHKVEKEMKSYDVKKVLSDFMKTLGYKALRGCGGDINMRFTEGHPRKTASVDAVVFEVQDPLNPELGTVYIDKKEAIEIIAKAKKIDTKNHIIEITS